MTMFNTPNQNKLYEAWAQSVFKASTLIIDTVGLGFRPVWSDVFNYIQKRIDFNNISKDAWILVLNDFDLTATKALRDKGYYNIIMLVTDTTQEQTPTTYFFDVKFNDRKFKKLFPNGWSEIWKDVWFMNAVEVQDIGVKGKLLKSTHIEYKIQGDITKVNFDLIIANPPYGKIGAQITDIIRKEVKYKHFVNLLPANDYKRIPNLYQFVRNMEAINNGFTDAAVTTHLCEIVEEANEISVEEFEVSQYIDPQLDKYFKSNICRKHYAVDSTKAPSAFDTVKDVVTVHNTFITHTRDINHKYIPKTGTAYSVTWNIDKNSDIHYLHERYWTMGGGRQSTYAFTTFNTEVERDNYTHFMLDTGWKFMQKVFTAMNKDGWVAASIWAPKVDWTRAWTVEEILADYGYTAEEITKIMTDLENFNGIGG